MVAAMLTAIFRNVKWFGAYAHALADQSSATKFSIIGHFTIGNQWTDPSIEVQLKKLALKLEWPKAQYYDSYGVFLGRTRTLLQDKKKIDCNHKLNDKKK